VKSLEAYRRAFAPYLDAIDANWAARDADGLHDLRVALRRTRSLLKNAKGVVTEPERARFADGFQDLARATTTARDLDVLLEDWPQLATHDAICARRDAAHAHVASTLAADTTRDLMAAWRTWLATPPDFCAPRSRQRIAKVVRRRARKSRKRLERLAAVDTAEARHAWRKEAKRLRYLAEAFPKSFRPKLVRKLVEAQDALGRERDRMVQAAILEEIGETALADGLRRQPATPDPRRKLSRSLKRWIRAA